MNSDRPIAFRILDFNNVGLWGMGAFTLLWISSYFWETRVCIPLGGSTTQRSIMVTNHNGRLGIYRDSTGLFLIADRFTNIRKNIDPSHLRPFGEFAWEETPMGAAITRTWIPHWIVVGFSFVFGLVWFFAGEVTRRRSTNQPSDLEARGGTSAAEESLRDNDLAP